MRCRCLLQIFMQAFNSADAGTTNLVNSLASLREVDQTSLAASSLSTVMVSSQGAFAMDQTCLARCGFSSTNGGGYAETSPELLVGLNSLSIDFGNYQVQQTHSTHMPKSTREYCIPELMQFCICVCPSLMNARAGCQTMLPRHAVVEITLA